MLQIVVALLLGIPMLAAELKVDHVTVAGRDLGALERGMKAIGVPFEYGGPHSNHATEMALTSFPDGSYLELIAIQAHADPAAVAANQWSKCLQGDGGPCGWAARPADLRAEAARLRAAGVRVTEPARNGRKRPDGVTLDWETAQVGVGNGNFFPFLIHDFTPRERRAYPSGKPTDANFSGISKVVLAVEQLDVAAAQFEQAYGLRPPQTQDDAAFGARLAWFPGTPVVLAAPMGPRSWIAERLRRFGETPCAFVLGRGEHTGTLPVQAGERWFGRRVAWFSAETLGWRLGVE